MTSADAVKVVILGGSCAGKTSLLTRFVNGHFCEEPTSADRRTSVTIGGGFFTKSVMVGVDKVKLHLWDTAGSEAYHSITRMYYRRAQAGILCYDITDYSSFTELQHWAQELVSNEPDCRLYLCGCKLDMPMDRRQVSFAEARQFATAKSAAFFETSARTGENVTALFNRICCDAVDWNFVSITTGNKHQYKLPAGGGNRDGNRKSFVLTDRNDGFGTANAEDGGSGCFAGQRCDIA